MINKISNLKRFNLLHYIWITKEIFIRQFSLEVSKWLLLKYTTIESLLYYKNRQF